MESTKDNIRYIYLLPLVLVLVHYTGIFEVGVAPGLVGYSLSQRVFLGSAYGLAFILSLFQVEPLLVFLKRNWIFVIVGLFVLLSAFWSRFPSGVLMAAGHYFGGILVAVTAVHCSKAPFYKILFYLYLWSVFSLLGSLLAVCALPAVGVMPCGRWRGLFGHANQLGIACMVSVWIYIYFIYTSDSLIFRIKCFCLTCLAFYLILRADSMTSLICSILVVVFNSMFCKKKEGVAVFRVVGLFYFVLFCILGIALLHFYFKGCYSEFFFGLLGRESDLTGRTSLWAAGRLSFFKKMIFGWSFDSGRSVLSCNIISYGQFHNGYVDLLVAGGLVGVLLFVLLIIRLLLVWVRVSRGDYNKSLYILSFFLCFFVHNFTESSILRPPVFMWFVFVLLYILVDRQMLVIEDVAVRDVQIRAKVG